MHLPFIAAASLCLHLAACSTWQPIQQPLPEHLAARKEKTLRVTASDGRLLEIDYPRIFDDSLVGLRANGDRTAIALHDVTRAEFSRADNAATIAAVAAGLVAVGFVAAVASVCGGEGNLIYEPPC
jgi:hypothetical protein